MNGSIPKVVVSDTLRPDEAQPWAATTRVVRRADAHDAVAAIRQRNGGDALVFGSHVLWNDLLAHGLVDELHLIIGPGVVGDGVPAFEARPPVTLELLDAGVLDGSGLVVLKYAVHPD